MGNGIDDKAPPVFLTQVLFFESVCAGHGVAPNAARLMTPTADDRGGVISMSPPEGGFFVAYVTGRRAAVGDAAQLLLPTRDKAMPDLTGLGLTSTAISASTCDAAEWAHLRCA